MQLNDVLSDASSQPVSELAVKAHAVLAELTTAIQDTQDAVRLQELLGVNDQLCSLLAKVPAPQKPTLVLQGLGAVVNGGAPVDFPGTADLRHGRAAVPNGAAVEGGVDEEDDTPTTPRIDKGKGRAKPEPEVPEKVLSPTFLITESESEDEEAHYVTEVEAGPSPTDRFVRIHLKRVLDLLLSVRSRIWVAEEGEVFRKGTVLLGPEEMEGEYDGEELRREVGHDFSYQDRVLNIDCSFSKPWLNDLLRVRLPTSLVWRSHPCHQSKSLGLVVP